MAGKSDLSAAPNVQNVIVYVSNDNFAQAYSVGQQQQQQQQHQQQQNVPPANHHHQQNAGGGYHTAAAAMLPKPYPSDKQTTASAAMPPSSAAAQQTQGAYFGGGGFPPQQPQLVNNNIYQNGTPSSSDPNCNNNNSNSNQRPVKVVRATGGGTATTNNDGECDNNRDTYVDFGGYVTVMGADMAHQQSVRCDSVRSETAESSCSSLSSSADEGLAVVAVQNQSDMVVYDSSVSVRPGGGAAVLAVQSQPLNNSNNNTTTTTGHLNNQPPNIVVPYGWKRLLNNGSIIYISPSNTALSSPEQVKEYLLTNGTCKCGLECHFKYDNVFNFDPKVVSKPWVLLPDTNTGDLTKLCNHKRKIIAMASLDCKPPDPNNIKLRKEYGIKRKKRKISLPYTTAGGQIIANRDKITLNQPVFGKELVGNATAQQFWAQNTQMTGNHLQGYPENQSNFIRCHDQAGNRVMAGSPMVVGDGGTTTTAMMVQQTNNNNNATNISHQQQQQNHQISQLPPQNPNIHIQQQQIIGPNGQIINVQGPMNPNHNQIVNQIQNPANSVVIQGQTQHQQQQHRIFINNNGQPNEPSGPGRPNVQMVPVSIANQQRQDIQPHQQRLPLQQQFYNNNNSHPQYQQINHFDVGKNIRPFNLNMNGFRPQNIPQNNQLVAQQQKMQWQNRMNMNQNNIIPQQQQQQQQNQHNIFERVPPLHQHQPQQPMWQDDIKRKKVKLGKIVKNRPYHVIDGSNCPPNHSPCPNIDVRQIQNDNSRAVIINQMPHTSQSASSPSFMEDPSGYLAQQTALLNNTINRQTGANGCTGYVCNSPMPQQQPPPSPQQQQNLITVNNQPTNEVPLPSNMLITQMKQQQQPISNRTNQNLNMVKNQQQQQQQQQVSLIMSQYNNVNVADSSAVINDQQQQQYQQCHGCIADSQYGGQKLTHSRPNSQPGTPSSSGISSLDDPVTSSTYSEKHQASPDTRPIQGGTVSTSNVSPIDGNQSPNPHTPTPPTQQQRLPDTSQLFYQQQSPSSSVSYQNSKQECCSHSQQNSMGRLTYSTGIVTTMASGRTVGSNTITSVLAGRANTATVSINSPSSLSGSSTPNSINPSSTVQTQAITVNVSKSPLEMVQSVVSSIQVPNSQQPNIINTANAQQNSIVKHSPSGLPPGHILVSSGGQLIMASTGTNGQNGVMAPPPPKIISNQNSMPPISVSPMVTNVTAAVTQVIPAVAQQVLGQQTVLVNALPAPFVLQPGVTMTMDGVTNMQIPQLVTGNVIQQQIQIDNSDHRRTAAAAGGLLSPETKKKGKKRKMSQTVASMLQIAAAQQNSGMVQSFPQQIQMAHSPQGLTTAGPVMQALTIVPSKTGGPPQIVMNGQTQQLITNSQPTQQINLLQPVNLINGTTGVVQNFPAIQQFIVPNLGGMVMNPDGTATILQDTSNLGMQLQIQNVNGQNVLTPVQSNNVFNGGQSILAAGPAGMVIRAPNSQGKLIQQQHSPGAAQFLSPTSGGQFVVNGTQFSGQLSPLVANVSPTQQVTFGTTASQPQIRPNNSQQEFIQCGQTLMVPCTPATANIAVSSSNQNTTFVQQNTTIVQQQTTMVSNNQQIQNFQSNNSQNAAAAAASRTATTLNLDQNFIISSNDNKQMQAVVLQRDNSPQNSNYRQSVSTQTAVNQNTQSVTTNTFCQTSTISAGSPPDTTTLSPMGPGGQSPPTADTTTHSGSTDDGLSPAPSNCSTNCDVQGRQSCSMAMVHCISSSEPDSAELCIQNSEIDWRRQQTPKPNEFTDITSAQIHFKKTSTPTHIALAESSTLVSGLPFFSDQMKQQESVVSSRNYDKIGQKRKNSDTLIVMESRQMHTSLFDDDDEEVVKGEQNFAIGNLVWGPMKSFPAWPGKIISIENDEQVRVKWFGNEKYVSKIDKKSLQTLSEGLDAHHLARKKCRTSRKLNTQLENAIQEAMIELDKQTEYEKNTLKPLKTSPKITTVSNSSKKSGRLRSSQR